MKIKMALEEKERYLLETIVGKELERNAEGIKSCDEFKGTQVEKSANALREVWEKRRRELKAILAAIREAE